MSQRKNRVAVGAVSTFIVLVLVAVYAFTMVLSVPLGFVLQSGMSACLPSGTIVAASPSPTVPSETTQLPQETLDHIEERDLQSRAEQNMERYTYAETQTGVPWEAIAALHYREAGMRGELSILNGQPILGYSYVNIDGQTVGATPNDDAVNAANALKELALGVYDVDVTQTGLSQEDWGRAFLAYNRGYLFKRANVSYTASPYVMNGLDDQHMNMSWSIADTVRGVDGNKVGALAVLTYLGDTSLLQGACDVGAVVSPVVPVNPDANYLTVTSGAGMRTRFDGVRGLHDGIDLVGGRDVVAMAAGTIVFAEDNHDQYGSTAVKIDHGNGTFTQYDHLVRGSLQVVEDQEVTAGQLLGTMGTTGKSSGVHLHFQLWINDERVNPYAFLVEHGVDLRWSPYATARNTTPGPLYP